MSASLISSDHRLRKELRNLLEPEGFTVWEAVSENEAAEHLRHGQFRLVIFDLDTVSQRRGDRVKAFKKASGVPMIVLSRTEEDSEVVQALEQGADDFIVVPFNPGVLLARIYANIRTRKEAASPSIKHFLNGPISIDAQRHEVSIRGRIVSFSPKEFEILRLLVANKGEPIPNRRLLHEVWGEASTNDKHYLRVYISQIRKKLVPANLHHTISSVPRCGYKMDAIVEE